MNDYSKSKGIYTAEIRHQNKFDFFVIKFLNFIGLSTLATKYALSYGELKHVDQWSNMIMRAGKVLENSLLGGLGGNAVTYLALGTSNTAVADTQTALGAEITTGGLARHVVTPTLATTTFTNDTLQLVWTWTASSSFTVQEAGAFNASSAGTMYSRGLPTARSVVSGDTYTLTYKRIAG